MEIFVYIVGMKNLIEIPILGQEYKWYISIFESIYRVTSVIFMSL